MGLTNEERVVAEANEDPRRCAELLAALADPARLQIVRLLRSGSRNVTEIADALVIAAVNASHHLNVLRHAGLVRNEKQGRFVLYSLAPGVAEEAEACDRFQLGCCTLDLPRPDRGDDDPPTP